MRMCPDHWDQLRELVEGSKVGDQVAKTTEDIAIKRGDDPLLFAQTMISMNFVSMLQEGTDMSEEEVHGLINDTETCPICWTSEACKCPVPECGETWLDEATEMAVERYLAVMN